MCIRDRDPLYSGLLECPLTTRVTKQIDGSYNLQTNGSCPHPILTFQECFAAVASTVSSAETTNTTGSDPSYPPGCSASRDASFPFTVHTFFNRLPNSSTACASSAKLLVGSTASLLNVTLSVDRASQMATIQLRGPSAEWFGVGFGGSSMADQPWTVIVDGAGAVSERKLGNLTAAHHDPGTQLPPSVKVLSNQVHAQLRQVTVTRPLQGATSDYYTFDSSSADSTIPIIMAVGTSSQLSYHKSKLPGKLDLLPVGGAGACVCPEAPKPFGQASGLLVYNPVANQSADVGTGAVGFQPQKCAPFPATVLNEQRNPTCDIRHYQGGQWACHHMWSLLDADQPIPWSNQPLVFHHKYRFWVQPFTPVSYTHLRAHETPEHLVCRLLLEKKKKNI
eukprot:TRINITY_DN7322_c0_g1_i4.p1 TRINITY_DN7322_c0_g1~~TRINITY_DN7322_c0_g1_i4.p1  ORF type:complete len:393 (+),score=85.33 TRINITY_DN7322_c0_g1_i4:167-1345(+)